MSAKASDVLKPLESCAGAFGDSAAGRACRDAANLIRTLSADNARLRGECEELRKELAAARQASVKCTQTEDGECCYRKARRTIGDPRVSVGISGTGQAIASDRAKGEVTK